MADQKPISKSGSKANTPPERDAEASPELAQEGASVPATDASATPDAEAAAKTAQATPQARETEPEIPSDRREAPAAMSTKPCSCQSEATPSGFDCNPCSDPIATANRVIRDPNVSNAVSELLGVAAKNAGDSANMKSVQGALEGIAKAFAGKDAVRAKGESCGGQLRLSFEIQDPVTNRRTALDAQLASSVLPRLIDQNWNLAANASTFEGDSHVFRDVEPGLVRVGLAAEIVDGGEISPLYRVKYPNETGFREFQKLPPSNTGTAATTVTLTSDADPTVPENTPITFTASLSQSTSSKPGGKVTFYSYPDPDYDTSPPPTELDTVTVSDGEATSKAVTLPAGLYAITATYSGDENYAPAISNPLVEEVGQPYTWGQGPAGGTDSQSGNPTGTAQNKDARVVNRGSVAPKTRASSRALRGVQPLLTQGFVAQIFAGMETAIKLVLIPPAAHVRCFSWLDGEGAGCLQGKQYISRVAISAMQGDNFVACKATSDSGCSGFKLNPGWYTFSAPEDITIEGCNYTLSTSSPVSAFVGAGQCCSDIFFRYKKKGNEIQVISKISFVDPGNPNKEVNTNFAGLQYLLLRDNDPTFVQQQTTSDGSAVYFRNLAAGAYLLFCQAPATYGSQPVQPVYPQGGRLALTVFAGQTSAVPVQVTFRTGITAPAVLNGYVRDETGQSIPGQLVTVVNLAGCVIAAAVTDANGLYSLQIYVAENLTILWGTQSIPVSKSQIQAAMTTVGTPALPSPGASMELAMQTSELVQGL